jgi:small-conductance mechanosensitive channel
MNSRHLSRKRVRPHQGVENNHVMINLISDSAVFWTVIVAVCYPVLAIGLVEFRRATERSVPELARIASLVQITVLPPLAIYLLAHYVAQASPEGVAIKLLMSVLAITTINACLALINVMMRSGLLASDWVQRTPALVLDLARMFLVLIAAAFVASEIWAVDLGSLLAALGVGSVVLGLALQDTVSGLFAGVSLMSGRHFKEGDWIEFGDIQGCIVQMNWRTVTVETLDDRRLVVIPNSELSSSNFTVLQAGNRSFGENIEVSFSYSNPPARVMDALERAVQSVDLVLEDPPYDIDLVRHDQDGIVYEVTIHARSRKEGEEAVTEILRKLWYISQREGLVPSGAANRMYRSGNPYHISRDMLAETIGRSALFDSSRSGFDAIVEASRSVLFDAGEILMLFNDPFRSLYLVVNGALSVMSGEGNEKRVVQTVAEGEIFIGRAFLTGAPATIALVADGEVSVIEIPSSPVLAYLMEHTDLARRFESVIDMTEHGLAAAS